ncbi:MAG: hypothetical protein ACFB4J_16625 [Elainellaceae cyanobacterium]
MTTKRPFIPLITAVVLLAAGGGGLLALTIGRQPDPAPLPESAPSAPASIDPTPAEAPSVNVPTDASASPAASEQPAPRSPEPSAQSAQYDTTIIPGERVGPITPNTTRQDLVELFGEQQIVDMEVHVGEGFYEPGVELTLDDGHSLSLIWTDAAQSGVREVRDLGPAWQTPEGIRVGMPIDEFKRVAGEFEFLGFGWDYGGTIQLETSELAQYGGALTLRMGIDYETVDFNSPLFQSVQGDSIYASESSRFEELGPYIEEMIITLTPTY